VPYTIAITGKGGVGKTTLASLLVTRLIARGRAPVLAVDADPNTCLDAALGVEVVRTIGTVREQAREMAGRGLTAGVSKRELLELKIAESMVEAEGFDLIAMGRPEGPGCYCYANNVLRQAIGQISQSYPYVVLDNEAGLENLSRRIVGRVDLLIMVADPSKRGLETVGRLHDLATEMALRYEGLAIVINRMRRPDLPEAASALKVKTGADRVVGLPEDGELAELGERGEALMGLPGENPVVEKLDRFLTEIGLDTPGDGTGRSAPAARPEGR
jgi:CO dehydrogenase maturation factor